MHRSGTSMLSRILENLGLFVGYEKEQNNEALFFQKLNMEILNSAYGTWERPGFLHKKIVEETFRNKWKKELVSRLESEESKSFLGESLWKKFGAPNKITEPWGWKDPRNTYTLPLWLEIFPDAKIIHIYRHGIDVANSLKVRHGKRQSKLGRRVKRILSLPVRTIRYIVKNRKFPTKESRQFYLDNLKTSKESNLFDAFSLWEEYVEESLKHVEKLKDKSISLKYEDILEDPFPHIKKLVEFCELNVSDAEIKEIIKQLDKGRQFAYKNNSELVEFETKVKERLSKFGY